MLSATGWGSQVIGGDLPANSGKTAFSIIGCNNRAGVDRMNTKADVNPADGIQLSNVRTRTWTAKNGRTVSSYSRQHIEKVTLADTPLGSLYLSAVVSTTRAWHGPTGFHSSSRGDLADIVFEPVIGDPQRFPVPLPGQSVTIPGLAKLSLGVGTETANGRGARAAIDAVKLHVIPTDTTVYLAHSAAAIKSGTPKALYRGSAFGLNADVADGLVTSQRTPNIPTPCLGSGGKTLTRSIAAVDPMTDVHASALRATTKSGKDVRKRDFVTNTAKVARISLGNGLKVNAIEARAHVHKAGNRFVKNSNGTTLGAITLNGEKLTMPRTGVLEIPGVARLETNIVSTTRTGITVTALRVTLLDGRLGTVDVGYAKSDLLPTRI